jgi:hypothetical protein
MSYSIEQMRALSDEQLVREHDAHAVRTVVGTGYYLEELERRSRDRATEASNRLAADSVKLARATFWLTVASTIASVAAVAISVVALVVSGS